MKKVYIKKFCKLLNGIVLLLLFCINYIWYIVLGIFKDVLSYFLRIIKKKENRFIYLNSNIIFL